MRKILVVTPPNTYTLNLPGDYEVTYCHNSLDAADLLHENFAGLILDLFLPGTDGLTLLEQTQDRLPPVVLILTRFLSPYVLQTVDALCGGYILRIPCPE